MRTDCLFLSAALAVVTAVLLTQAGCGSGDGDPPAASMESSAQTSTADTTAGGPPEVKDPVQVVASDVSTETPAKTPKVNLHPEVVMTTDAGDIRIRLDAEKAPLTTENFLANYVERGFYTGTVFHYVEKDYMIVGGGYTANLEGKDTRAFLKNEAGNGLKNKRGTVAMIRQPEHIHSATSQFFINLADNPELDYRDDASPEEYGYCVFGEVVEGMDVVESIAETPVADKDQFPSTPVEPIAIRSVDLVR